jgi:hypothetical protein
VGENLAEMPSITEGLKQDIAQGNASLTETTQAVQQASGVRSSYSVSWTSIDCSQKASELAEGKVAIPEAEKQQLRERWSRLLDKLARNK